MRRLSSVVIVGNKPSSSSPSIPSTHTLVGLNFEIIATKIDARRRYRGDGDGDGQCPLSEYYVNGERTKILGPRKISDSTSFHKVQNLVHDMVRLENETPVQLNCVQGTFPWPMFTDPRSKVRETGHSCTENFREKRTYFVRHEPARISEERWRFR